VLAEEGTTLSFERHLFVVTCEKHSDACALVGDVGEMVGVALNASLRLVMR
jgi:hypothetical protein